ncbi:LytS/YhcK type 5TM receptor domain-containing protein [Alkalibacillus haloalkaliphilus]|uniref:LytS/YhcK type 5TM receptor domain-containing protein n=1 Tax=Alkalibacillus haloalkaliphilus TaxID=94136 RepID=UPI0002ECBCD2|nr:LytS/YhcK type 5TM receptor domain-containing protein [Alkalibacillus haloalkaliphilus]
MIDVMILLFERIGLLLLVVFMLTQIPGFRSLLDRDIAWDTIVYHALVFGVMGVLGTHIGVIMNYETTIIVDSWILNVEEEQVLIGFGVVVVMIAGLLGGPYVGLGSGAIVGIYMVFMGGEAWLANSLINPVSGLMTGLTAKFFSDERVIAPNKALFIGIFPPVLYMGMILIFNSNQQSGVEIVDRIGIPLVITNAIALAIIMMMIRSALNETEREAALETNRALSIAEQTLPILKGESLEKNAGPLAELLYKELDVAAIAIADQQKVLSFVGEGEDHHKIGEPVKMRLSKIAMDTGELQVAYDKSELQCMYKSCPLQTAIMVPIYLSREVIGLINLYFPSSQQLRAIEIELARGLGTIISNQISGYEAERMKELLKEAEIRNLQAQINPHFLFNTFNLIHSLMRVDHEQARRILVSFSQYMRANLNIASRSLIPLGDELEHVNTYLDIVTARFPDQLKVKKDIDPNVLDALIPSATLQPLVENCIQHGLKHHKENGLVVVNINQYRGHIFIEVRDNGVGFSEDVLPSLGKVTFSSEGNGMALYNVNERLIGIFGEESQLYCRNLESQGSSVSFIIPIQYE